MIPFDFTYCRPDSLKESHDVYAQLCSEGKCPIYYSGGSEIISMCRAESIKPDAVIDIKDIPECMLLSHDGQRLIIGSACTLNQIKESKLFPLLGTVCGRIADHTNQCRITLGGNLCGTIIYRETSLPLLISDAQITLLGQGGIRTLPFEDVFFEKIKLPPDEFLVQIHLPSWALLAKYYHVKRTPNEKIDYPLLSIAAVLKGNYMRIAFSGICSYPFRSRQIEAVLNDHSLCYAERADRAAAMLPNAFGEEQKDSREYRIFVLKNTLQALLEGWENGQI